MTADSEAPGAFACLLGRSPVAARWALLVLVSVAIVVPLELAHLPAAALLGSLAAAILLGANDARLEVPRWPFLLTQGLIGCLVAGSVSRDLLPALLAHWPVFIVCVTAVLAISTTLGLLLARWRLLPGTTAIWGSCPGAATVMVLMSEGFGGDPRLVAVMQFFRVMLVASTAAIVARLFGIAGGPAPAVDWFPALAPAPLLGTLLLAFGGAVAGEKLKIPAGALLLPLLLGGIVSGFGWFRLSLPPWLLLPAYASIGWAIGLRFTRSILAYAARAFPTIALSTATLILLCAGLAWMLHEIAGIDPLTAYLATSPGGADSMVIIAVASKADIPFVMAMQTARFLLVMLIGPSLVRVVASLTGSTEG